MSAPDAATTPVSSRRGSLQRILGIGFGLAVTVGNTIGAGILRTPGDVAALLPTVPLFLGVWVVGALYAALGANALAELGTMLPRSGAQYVFARHTFGDYAGFVVGWIDWIATSASAAAIAIVIGESAAFLLPGLPGGARGIAMAVIVFFGLLLLRSTRVGGRSQQITSLLKALALAAFVAACFAFRGGQGVTAVPPAAASSALASPSLLVAFVLAAQSVVYSYDGWNAPVYFSEELRDPGREIPRSMFGGLAAVAIIYLLVNVACLVALPLDAFAGSPLAAATVASALFGAGGERFVRIVVVIALPSAVNACLLMASRVLYAMSRDGLGIRMATRVNAGGVPTVALLLGALVALAFIATGTFESVIAVAAFYFVANYALSFLAVFVLRRRTPTAPRPWRAWGHPVTTAVVLLGSLAFLAGAVAADRANSAWALAILALSVPVFLVVRRFAAGAKN